MRKRRCSLGVIRDLDSEASTKTCHKMFHMYGVFIIELLVFMTFGHAGPQRRPVICGSYNDVLHHEERCRNSEQEGTLFNLLSGLHRQTWTGDDLRAGLRDACRRMIYREYQMCAMQLENDCPSLASDVTFAVSDKVRPFCSHGNISSMLDRALSVPIHFNGSCVRNRHFPFNTDCVVSLRDDLRPWSRYGNLSTILEHSESIATRMYGCLKEGLVTMDLPSVDPRCTSTLQELVFGYMLSIIGGAGLGISIPENVMNAMTTDLEALNQNDEDIFLL